MRIVVRMQPVVFHQNRVRMIAVMCVGTVLLLFFTALGALGFVSRDFSLASIVFFLLGLGMDLLLGRAMVAIVRKLKDRRPLLVMDEEGITDRDLPEKIPWTSIQDAQIIRLRAKGLTYSTMIRLWLADEQERLMQLSPGDRKKAEASARYGYGAFKLDITNLSVRGERLFALMNQFRSHAGMPALIDGVRTSLSAQTVPSA